MLWRDMAGKGQLRNEFNGPSGERIEAGIRMLDSGLEHYAINLENGEELFAGLEERTLPPSLFVLRLNRYRSLKPQTPASLSIRPRQRSQDPAHCLFACQDSSNPLSLLHRHAPIQTTLGNSRWAGLPNALPVEKNGHFLWVPRSPLGDSFAYPHSPQVLTFPLLQDFLTLASFHPDVLTYFNGLGAGASVNHIHFQSVCCDGYLPIKHATVRAIGRHYILDDYPVAGIAYPPDTPEDRLWRDIDQLQSLSIPLNLISVGRQTYLISRNSEHEIVDEFPGAVLAGMELSGKLITSHQDFYQRATWSTIQTALQRSTLATEDLLCILS